MKIPQRMKLKRIKALPVIFKQKLKLQSRDSIPRSTNLPMLQPSIVLQLSSKKGPQHPKGT